MWFTELAFDWLPGYNKFRTVSMALVVVQWTVPLLGALALMRLWRDEIPRRRLFKALGWAAGVTGGLCLLLAVAGGSLFDFGREESAAMMTEQFHQILKANNMQEYLDRGMDAEMGIATADAMAAERASMMQADAWRSLLMILLAAGGVALFALRRINKYALTALLGAVMLLDLVPVDLRFLSHDDFISARRRQITATAADKAILADKDPGFRVLNLTVSPFQDATTSYFHRSVGGYHGAKLARYQDLIDRYLSYRNDAVLDMLNTRYLIVPGDDGQPQAVRRATANGPAWFVDGIVAADTPQQEIDLLGSVDLKTTAVAAPADKAFAEEWQAGGQADTTLVRGIALTEYRPNYQKYEYTAPEESVAVFSEIFYDHGWTAYVDGEAMPGFRADYILRAMKLPAGRHTVASAVQHDQIAAEVLQNNFGRVSFLTVVVFPFAGLELSFQINFGTFAEISLGDVGKLRVENNHAMPLGSFLSFAGNLVFPAVRGSDVQIDDFGAAGRVADFGVSAQVTD